MSPLITLFMITLLSFLQSPSSSLFLSLLHSVASAVLPNFPAPAPGLQKLTVLFVFVLLWPWPCGVGLVKDFLFYSSVFQTCKHCLRLSSSWKKYNLCWLLLCQLEKSLSHREEEHSTEKMAPSDWESLWCIFLTGGWYGRAQFPTGDVTPHMAWWSSVL